MKIRLVLVLLMVNLSSVCFGEDIASFSTGGNTEAAYTKLSDDQAAFLVYHDDLSRLFKYISKHKEIFPTKKFTKTRLLKPVIRKEALNAWKSYLDYNLALDSLSKYYETFDGVSDEQLKADSFKFFNSLFLAEYRFALEFINIAENDPGFDIIFNEPVPELGLPADTYSNFKLRYLNIMPALKFATAQAVYSVIPSNPYPDLDDLISEDSTAIWNMGVGTGEALTISNILAITKNTAYFPVRAGLAECLTNHNAPHVGNNTPLDQINKILPRLEPGDILLERHEDTVALIGIPGFWTHAALYIGTPEERNKYFDDSEIDSILSTEYPEAYQESLQPGEENHKKRIIEAITKGVSFATLECSSNFDFIAVLRPKLDEKAKAEAIMKAFSFIGRPYDFDFDFLTDSELICSELVYKVYETEKDEHKLDFDLRDFNGFTILSPNDIAEKFDTEYDTSKRQLDFVCFVDKNEKDNSSFESSVNEFRKTWQRPKWKLTKN